MNIIRGRGVGSVSHAPFAVNPNRSAPFQARQGGRQGRAGAAAPGNILGIRFDLESVSEYNAGVFPVSTPVNAIEVIAPQQWGYFLVFAGMFRNSGQGTWVPERHWEPRSKPSGLGVPLWRNGSAVDL